MFIQTAAALSNTPPLTSESISRLHAETSNSSLTRPHSTSNNMSVTSPHSDPEKRLVTKSQDFSIYIPCLNIL